VASIDDNRRTSVITKPAEIKYIADSVRKAEREKLIQQDFLLSLDYNPISIRETWKSLYVVAPSVKRVSGNRILSLKMQNNKAEQWIALVTFKKTGERKYRQNVLEFSKSGDFIISDQKWKELKKMELLLVIRDIESKTDHYSNFFQLKRRKIKSLENPFKHN
jgi:hypothetical protein